MTDINRWYARCLMQLGIDPQTEPERAEAARDALACFSDDHEWLAWLVMHSEWYLGSGEITVTDIEGEDKEKDPTVLIKVHEQQSNNLLDLTVHETAISNFTPEELKSLSDEARTEAESKQFAPDPYKECMEKGVRYGTRLPYWFVDFYRTSSASCTPAAYELWAAHQYTPHFAQPDGEWTSFDSVNITEITPDAYIDLLVAAGRVNPPKDQNRKLYRWMVETQRAQESPQSARVLFEMLLSEVRSSEQKMAGTFAGWEVIQFEGSSCIRREGSGTNYVFSTFQNDCTKLLLTRKSRSLDTRSAN